MVVGDFRYRPDRFEYLCCCRDLLERLLPGVAGSKQRQGDGVLLGRQATTSEARDREKR